MIRRVDLSGRRKLQQKGSSRLILPRREGARRGAESTHRVTKGLSTRRSGSARGRHSFNGAVSGFAKAWGREGVGKLTGRMMPRLRYPRLTRAAGPISPWRCARAGGEWDERCAHARHHCGEALHWPLSLARLHRPSLARQAR